MFCENFFFCSAVPRDTEQERERKKQNEKEGREGNVITYGVSKLSGRQLREEECDIFDRGLRGRGE
jgi:hypothetical protein